MGRWTGNEEGREEKIKKRSPRGRARMARGRGRTAPETPGRAGGALPAEAAEGGRALSGEKVAWVTHLSR